jgi:ABC-2 type transport system ATP-binding protein
MELNGLCRSFRSGILGRRSVVLDGLDLRVEEGEIFGYLGANGAGKTTTIRILLGLIRPDSGNGTLLGHPLGSLAGRRGLGFLSDSPDSPERLLVREHLKFCGRLHALSGHSLTRRVEESLDSMEVRAADRDRSLGDLSRGTLQRVRFAAATLHRPRLLILDEPMSGLDPMGRRLVRDTLVLLRDGGTTVFLSSHVLSDVESMADRVGILRDGHLVACGRAREIGAADCEGVDIVFHAPEGVSLAGFAGVLAGFRREARGWTGCAPDRETARGVVAAVLDAGCELVEFVPSAGALEERFLREVCQSKASGVSPLRKQAELFGVGALPENEGASR